ncbi:DHKTD1 [Mytilus edulis]|uniref:DHKTD1 n=1 Tax=Mytilus edulis TaxID=6550 RepID=A0A8S3VN18_MYTED|nr:DHKTD1 [Mytilus edulis]
MMAIFDEIFSYSSQDDISHIVMCMPHRGRLNFLTCMLKFPPVIMFQKMKGKSELPPGAKGTGDVLSHLYTSEDIQYHGKDIHVSLIPNPSHLEANNPVAVGKARSKQQRLKVRDYSETDTSGQRVLCVQVHGDASFSAQGVVAETFGFAECPHFNVGRSIHIIVNNQLGFTTEPSRASPPCIILLIKEKSIPDMFSEQVITDGICNKEVLDKEVAEWNKELSNNLDMVEKHVPKAFHLQSDWSICQQAGDVVTTWDTGVALDTLKFVGAKSVSVPSDMNVHPTIQKTHLDRRLQKIQDGGDLDWATAEALAIGSLLYQGMEYGGDLDWATTGSFSYWFFVVSRYGGDLDWATTEALAIGSLLYQGMEYGVDLDWATAEALAIGSLLYQGMEVDLDWATRYGGDLDWATTEALAIGSFVVSRYGGDLDWATTEALAIGSLLYGVDLDWATAEALAIGSLLYQGMEYGVDLDWATAEALAIGSLLYPRYGVDLDWATAEALAIGSFVSRYGVDLDLEALAYWFFVVSRYGVDLDWATAEALAIGSLLYQGME